MGKAMDNRRKNKLGPKPGYAPGKYRVWYDNPYKGEVVSYTSAGMTREVAEWHAEEFRCRYLNEDGTGQAYPNGEGVYAWTNIRVLDYRPQYGKAN